ncbi:hypothetical protein, partial [Agrobacterium salinitolerans]|uniref:hypothetical protein n=1 Tax=Agrobacterium salinitolerans TaxID=1183413 RepID=UPI00196B4581
TSRKSQWRSRKHPNPPGDEETRLILSPVHPQKTTTKRHHPETEKTRRKYQRVCQRSEPAVTGGFFYAG